MGTDAEQNDFFSLSQEQKPLAILFFEKDTCFVESAVNELAGACFVVSGELVSTIAEVRAKLFERSWDLIIGDFDLGNRETALDLLAQVQALDLDIPVILLTSGIGDEKAAKCIKHGAADYLLKEHLNRLPGKVRLALQERAVQRERLRLEEQSKQDQKMESISRLAGAVAHDFNNLLEIVVGYSELLLQEIPIDNRLWKNADEIKKAGMRAASLTRQLLAFSRRQVLGPRLLDLNEVLVDMERTLRRAAGDQIELVMLLDENLGLFKGDATQFEQVISNLVLHACEGLRGEGKITIETANVDRGPCSFDADHHDEAANGPHVMLAVSNGGKAQNPSQLTSEPFTGQRKGARGLGLAMVYEVVRYCKGHIWVQSDSDQGTTFKIYLPSEAAGQHIHHDEKETAEDHGTLVLAEDETATRELISRVLANSGYRVLEAANGKDALDFFLQSSNSVDLLITDLVMPVMGGGELARRATELSPRTKVLYISGFTDDPNIQKGVLEGAAYLQKPFRLELLSCKVRELLGQPVRIM